MKQLELLRDKIGTEYLMEDAAADGYNVYPIDNNAPLTYDTSPNDYVIIADGKPYLIQTDPQPIVIDIIDASAVAEHLDNGAELANWMQSLI